MWAENILDWFMHPSLRSDSLTYAQARIVASSAIIAAGTVPLFAMVYYLLGHPMGALVCVITGCIVWLALLILKFFGRIHITREIMVGAVYCGVTWLSYSQGGLMTPGTFWLILPPIIAVFLGGMSSGFYWLGVSAFTAIALYAVQFSHLQLPLSPVHNASLLMVFSIIGLTCVIMALAYFFQLAKIEGFAKLELAASIITEKSRALFKANQELNKQATRTHAILNAAADGIITTNSMGFIATCNRAAATLFGYEEAALLHANLQNLFDWSGRAPAEIIPLETILNSQRTVHELTGLRKDGSHMPLEVIVSRIAHGDELLFIWVLRDLTERKRSETRLAQLAHYDHLTGLPNRTLYEILLSKALAKAKRSGKLCALLFLDLDYFKHVNDTLGHDIGDLLLKEVSGRIKSCIRAGDTVARLGGDEFTVILDELSAAEDAAKIAQLILDVVSPSFILNGFEIFSGVSIGIALYPLNGEDAISLVKYADMALYTAKEKGRRNYQFFNAELNTQNLARVTLANNLHNALRLQEFEVYYQPQIDIKTGAVIGVEALLRWHNATLGEVLAETFIPIAEKIGLISPIGAWMLHTACLQFKQWSELCLVETPIKLALNLSSVQLKQGDLPEMLLQILQSTQLRPEHIELELTETAIMQDRQSAIKILQQLDKLGFCIAIDDFGTGYSSLSYLKCLPVHSLKIDKTFIKELTTDHNDALIIKAIIALGHGLELKVLAEGVETAAQLDYLRQNGCDQAQGYYISRPLSAEAMTAFLQSSL